MNLFGCGGITAVLVALLAYAMGTILFTFDQFKPDVPNFNNEGCKRIAGDIPAVEDLMHISATMAIGTSDDRRRLWQTPEGATTGPDGDLVLLDRSDPSETKVTKLKRVGFPKGDGFHPHGGFVGHEDGSPVLSTDAKPIFVWAVNHAYGRGGERVDMFRVDVEARTVTYVRSIRHNLFDTEARGILNDVVVTSKGTMYVSRWVGWPHPPHGPGNPENFLDVVKDAMNIPLLTLAKRTCVYKCTYGEDASSEVQCKVAIPNLSGANGLSRSVSGKAIAVVDTTENRLDIYDVTGESSPTRIASITAPHKIDDLDILPSASSEDTTVWVAGAMPRIMELTFVAMSVDANAQTAALMLRYTPKDVSNPLRVETLLVDDGNAKTKLPGISSAVMLGDTVYQGSWANPGILACKLKNTPAMLK